MRARHFRTGSAWAANLYEAPEPEVYQAPNLPPSQKFALMYLRKAGDNLAAKIVATMKAMGIGFALADFDQLRAFGFVTRPPGQHHILTPEGFREAERIANDLAEQYEIHVPKYVDPSSYGNMGAFGSCSCGHWRLTVGRRRAERDRLRRAYAKHLEDVNKGTWKRGKPQAAFLDEVFGPLPRSDSAKPYTITMFSAAEPETVRATLLESRRFTVEEICKFMGVRAPSKAEPV